MEEIESHETKARTLEAHTGNDMLQNSDEDGTFATPYIPCLKHA